MKEEFKPACKRCGANLPVGLQLDVICVKCLIKPRGKDI